MSQTEQSQTQNQSQPTISSLITLTLPNILNKRTSKLLSCLSCSIILPSNHFHREGCPNCGFEDFHVSRYTSSKFSNISVVYKVKWVAAWQHYRREGVYALKVVGVLSEECVEDLVGRGVVVRGRDKPMSI